VLQWFDNYAAETVIFQRQYIEAIRDRIAAMPPNEFNRWAIETVALREKLGSSEWQEAREWLRVFLEVSASSSSEDIVQARANVEMMSPGELIDLVSEITHYHRNVRLQSAASQEQRRASLAAAVGFQKQRLAALNRAGVSRAPRYSSHAQYPVARPRRYKPRRPFVGVFFRF
jgi:hypothetical protein